MSKNRRSGVPVQRAQDSKETQLVDQTPVSVKLAGENREKGRTEIKKRRRRRYKEEGFYFLSPGR